MMQKKMISSYEEAVSYCMDIPRFTGKNSMAATKAFYKALGMPAHDKKIIHVAGTNGKGSVCAFLYSILRQMGKKTGMFTSPHLTDIRERIQMNGCLVDKEKFYCGFSRVYTVWQEFVTQAAYENYHPSFFEMLFFVGMCVFEKEDVEYLILETGLGGRLDTTNIIEHPILSIITKIGYDHTEYLGDTLVEIAKEKAGIIKKNTPILYWKNQDEISEVFEEKAKESESLCISVSKADGNLIRNHHKQVDFSYKSRYYEYVEVKIDSSAVYQIENATLALRAIETIFSPHEISIEILQQGIYHMNWKGRMEEVLPGVYFDGAHNEDGIAALLETVKQDGCKGRRYLLFSVVEDKRYKEMTEAICESGVFNEIITVQMDNKRGLDSASLKNLFKNYPHVSAASTAEAGLLQLLDERKQNDYIYVTGSLYLIGQLKQFVEENVYD